jgi:site-specific DNA-methyltransferase (adenine-specific)
MKNQVILGDCLEVMKDIPDKSIDMILCDLPYGTTACKWDTIIPFEPLWEQYKRIIKDNGAIVLTASQPFTSALVMSNVKMFKYCWVWNKKQSGNHGLAKYQPMKIHEDIAVFSKNKHDYYPIMTKGKLRFKGSYGKGNTIATGMKEIPLRLSDTYYPKSIIEISKNRKGSIHPTQKPVALFEYLIKTYTSVGDVVLDNTIGSGTTAVAAINTGRNWIGIEQDAHYCEIANERIKKAYEEKEQEYIDIINERLSTPISLD